MAYAIPTLVALFQETCQGHEIDGIMSVLDTTIQGYMVKKNCCLLCSIGSKLCSDIAGLFGVNARHIATIFDHKA